MNNIENGLNKNDLRKIMMNAIHDGVIDETFIGFMMDSVKKKSEADDAAFELREETRKNDLDNAERLDQIVNAIENWNSLGVQVTRLQRFADVVRTSEATNKFKIKLDDWTTTPRWFGHLVMIPTALLMECYDQAIAKYGIPLIKDIIHTFEQGGAFWKGELDVQSVVERGTRLVLTLEKRGWNPNMTKLEYNTWKSNLPDGIIAVIIRTIMSGCVGHMNCLGCKYAIFDDSGYCRCRRKTAYVPINDNHLEGYIYFAKKKEVYADCVYSDIIQDITAECILRKKVCSEEQLRFNQAYARKYGK